jgi:hypothetical protein
MTRQGKIFILLLICTITQFNAVSSQTTSSPYSIFGLGYLESNSIGPNKAMGGTGIAFLSEKSINMTNPASYSGLDSLLSIFEIAVFGKYTMFSTKKENQSLVNANLKYITMGFRITPWLATSFGFAPYSSIGYHINTHAPIEGTNLEYLKTFSGEGGVNQVYLGGSVKVLKNLSLGINAAYLFGDVTHSESSDLFSYSLKDVTYVSNFDFNYGLNYHFEIKNWEYFAGLTYSSSKNLKTDNETTIKTGTGTEVLKSRIYKYKIPQNIGVGLAVRKDFFMAGVDFERSNWNGIDFNNSLVRTRNSNRYSFGVEFPSLGIRKGTSKMFLFRFGAEYRESYLIIDNIPISYRAVTFGTGIPLNGALSTINISLELGQNGTIRKDLFRETFFTLHLDMSLRDLWFIKRKYM